MRLAASYCVVVGTKSDDFVDYSYQVNDEDDVIIGSVQGPINKVAQVATIHGGRPIGLTSS